MSLTKSERDARTDLLTAAARAHQRLVTTGDSVLLLPRVEERVRGVFLRLDDLRCARVALHLQDWVRVRPTTWHMCTVATLARPPPSTEVDVVPSRAVGTQLAPRTQARTRDVTGSRGNDPAGNGR